MTGISDEREYIRDGKINKMILITILMFSVKNIVGNCLIKNII